jgi:hypothetical protein
LKALNIEMSEPQPYFGVRVEVSNDIFEPLLALGSDPKLILYTNRGDKIKTHCVTASGSVISCKYSDFILTDGRPFPNKKGRTPNTSFNIITRIKKPVFSHNMCMNLINYMNKIGQDRIMLQRLDDLVRCKSTTNIPKNPKPTLEFFTLTDLNLSYPRRIICNVLYFLQKIKALLPGFSEKNTLIYAPVAEWITPKVKINKNFRTSLKGLYIIGDASGYTQGMVAACTTAVIAIKDIKKEIKNKKGS